MKRGAAVAHGVIAALVLALAFSAGSGVAGAQQQGIDGNDTVDVDVRVWQHVRDPLRIYISARPEGVRWDTLGTIRLLLDDGLSSGRAYRFGDITVEGVEVRVWQRVTEPLRIFISARPVGGDWDVVGTIRLLLDDGHSTSGNYRYGDITVAVPLDTDGAPVVVSPGGEEVPRLAILTIAFREPPGLTDGSRLVSIDPPVEGSFVWADARTLLFQPDYPGWQRGQQYRVRVDPGRAGLDEAYDHTFTVEGQLEVAHVIPGDGDTGVPANAQLLVQFNRSVAALTVLQEGPAPPVLEFDPPIEGHGEWLNTSLYRFIPSNLQPSTTYSVRIPAGLTSAADGVLQSDHTWTFSTIQPAVTDLTPHDGSLRVEPDTAIVVTFNQPMNRASVEAGVVLREEGADLIAASFAWSERDTVVTLAPDEPLAMGVSYTVLVPVGLSGASRGATRFERIVRFTTIEPPRLLSTSPEDGETDVRLWRNVGLTYNNPMDPDSLEGRVSVSGIEADDIQVDWWDGNPEEFALRFDLEPSTRYTVRIAEGVRDRGGRSLPAHEFSFTTLDPSQEPMVSIQTPGAFATWAEGAPHVLRYHVSGHGAVRFQLYRLSESEARDLLSRAYIFNYASYVPFVPGSDPIREWTEQFGEDTRTLRSTDLGNGAPLPKGDYYLATFLGERSSYNQRLVFSVVDTAVVTKLVHGELLVWALDYDTGEPLAGMEVTSTVGLNTRAALEDRAEAEAADDAEAVDHDPLPPPSTALTNTKGIAAFPTEAYEDRAVRITEGGRLGVGATWWIQNSGPSALPVYKPQLVTHLYTERPIYRPGESVFYRGVVRNEDDATYSIPEGEERFQVRLRKRYGNVLPLAPVSLDELGTFSGEFVLPNGAPTGTYYVSLLYDGKSVAYTSFTVAEFRAPEFEVGIEPASADFVDGDRIPVEASARFYFGGPVADAAVRWSARASPTQFRVEGYGSYSFSDRDYQRESVYRDPLRSRGDVQTKGSGLAQFHVPAALDEGEGTQILTISATVTDASAQAVAASTTVTVHPAAWYAGVRPESYIARAGEPTTIDLVTVDFKGEIAPGRPVALRIYEREWVTTRTESVNGYRYRSEPHDTEIEVHSIQTNADAEASLTFTPPSAGTYRLVAEWTDDEGRVASSARSLWVTGQDRASWPGQDSDRFDLVPDRESYAVGDVAEVLVPAPYPGATALVTIERGRVLSTEVRTFETNSEVLRIPIKDAHLPNLFVSVVLYRPPTDDDPVPRYSVGYAKLPVSTAPRRLEVRIEPDREQAAPGETVRYAVQVTDAEGHGVEAAVSVAIVDRAVLSLADQFEADAMETFWYERRLGVWTASSLVVSLERLNETPRSLWRLGDSPTEWRWGQEYSGDPSDPPPPCPICSVAGPPPDPPPLNARSDFQNTALWLGQLTTDEDGRATFDLNLPDNATTWRARARAVTGETQVGEGESELLVTQPLLVRPALPRFLRVGDEVILRTLVRNGTSEALDVEAMIEVEGVLLLDEGIHTERVEAGESIVAVWLARALEAGTATVTFSATATGGYGDAVELSLPVYLDVTPETTATGGVVGDTPALEAVYLPHYVIAGSGSLELKLQASLVGALDEELPHFEPYQRESNVRIASRIVATIAVQRASADGLSEGQRQQIGKDIEDLVRAQMYDGGWAWCRSCVQSDMWVTGWVLIALGEARDAGYSVPDHQYGRTTQLITEYVNRETTVERPADPNQHAFLLYALTSAANEGGEVSQLAREQAVPLRAVLEEHRTNLTSWGRAYLLLALIASGHEPDHEAVRILLNDLAATTIASANGNHWEDERISGSMHNTSVRATALVLRALVEADPQHPLIEETTRWLVVVRSARWKSSVERAQGMASLGAFAQLTGENRGVYDYQVLLNTSRVLNGHFDVPARDYTDGVALTLDALPLGEVSRVQFEREAGTEGRMYYALNLRYVTPAKDIEALNRGFAVSHRYSLLEDPETPITSASLGDVVRVTVTVVAPADRVFARVEDFLPAGLEPIDPRLNIVSPWLREQLQRDQTTALLGGAPSWYAPWFAWYYSPWDQVDLRDDRVTLRAALLPRGVHEYVYYARATTPGDFFVAPAHAEETYFPDVFGRSDSGRFTVDEGN